MLITGAGGQLGLDLVDAFDDHEVVGLRHADLDVAVEADVVAAVRDVAPDLVVNAAAWTDVDGCEADPDRAHRVNALGAWWLARACELVDATLVHLSTDYVFGGAGARPSDESDRRPLTEFTPIAPVNEYGRSKAAGEALVRATLRRHHIVRTAWVSGARGSNFVRTMLRVGRERGEARVVDDQTGSPTFTRDLAAAIRELAVSGRYGTWNRTNSGTCTWYELAAAIYELAGVAVDLEPVPSTAFPRPAPRPAYSVLDDRHSVTAGLRRLPHWREGLAALLSELGEPVAEAP